MLSPDLPSLSHFQLIRNELRTQIQKGQLTVSEKLPAERKLAEDFNTTRITVREALFLLEAEGLIYREDRRGWFVAPPRMTYNLEKRSHFHEMVLAQGKSPATQWISSQTCPAPNRLCHLMHLSAQEPVHCIKRIRLIDERPVLYVEHYLIPDIFPDILSQDLNGSMTEIYHTQYDLQYGKVNYQLYPTALIGDAADYLNVSHGSQGLLIIRRNHDQNDRLIDCDFEYWRHDAITITADFTGGFAGQKA